MKTWLLITVLIIGLHAKDLQGISRDEFRKEGVELPRNILRLGRYCLRGEKLDRIVERIENPAEAKPALFACAFIAFQKSEKKVTPKYNSSTVNMRFKNFVQCVRDVARYNEEDDAAEYGVNMFCDMTEEEKAEYNGRVIPPDSNEPVGRDGDEYETDRKPGYSEIAVAGGGDVIGGDEISSPGDNTDSYEGESAADSKPGDSDIALPPIIVSGGYIGEDELSLPPTLGASELLERGVVLPLGAESVDRLCATSNRDEVQALSSLAYNVETEDAYLCAFTAFQSSKLKYTETYEDEADAEMRYNLFKVCVREVEEINAQNLTWTAAVNMFCDMTEEEKFPYFNGVRISDSELERANSEDAGFGFGAPMPRVKMPQVEFYIGEDELSHPPILPIRSFNQTEDFDVDACANGDVKKLAAKENKEEEDYVCAFLAFQNSAIKATEPYENEEEADWRYDIFKNSLIEIDRLNEEDNDWSAGITKFVDMNTKERQKNSLGRRNP